MIEVCGASNPVTVPGRHLGKRICGSDFFPCGKWLERFPIQALAHLFHQSPGDYGLLTYIHLPVQEAQQEAWEGEFNGSDPLGLT